MVHVPEIKYYTVRSIQRLLFEWFDFNDGNSTCGRSNILPSPQIRLELHGSKDSISGSPLYKEQRALGESAWSYVSDFTVCLCISEIKERMALISNVCSDGLSHISESQAALLPNKTVADQSGGENKYLVVLSVFHHLHCLDAIRKGIYYFFDDDRWNASHNPFSASPDIFDQQGDVERETETEEEGTSADDGAGAVPQLWHIDHCIDSLRQAIQCASDISPYVFQWSEEDRGVRAFADVAHTCRDFDAVSVV